MKLAIICVTIGATLGLGRCAMGAEITAAESAYCHAYAESEYWHAADSGSGSPDAAYEGAGEECEVQWLALAAQWDDPANLGRLAVLGLRAGVQ